MATVGTIRVVNTSGLARKDVAWTTVLSLADGVFHSSNTTFELSAVNAQASPVRVQWHSMGMDYPSGYRRQLRIIFKVDLAAGGLQDTGKLVTITDATTASAAWSLHSALVAGFAASPVIASVNLSGYHFPSPNAIGGGPNPQGQVRIDFNIANATIIDQWKDPTNAIVTRFRITSRGDPSLGVFGRLFCGHLDLEVASNSRIAYYTLHVVNSLIDNDTSPAWYPNPNPIIHLYNNTVNFGQGVMNGGVDTNNQGVFFTVNGSTPVVRDSVRRVKGTTVSGSATRVRLIDPNNTTDSQPWAFIDGMSIRIEGALLFYQGSPTGDETATMAAELVDQVWATSQDWLTNQNFGFLGTVCPIPANTKTSSGDPTAAAAQARFIDEYYWTKGNAWPANAGSSWGHLDYFGFHSPPYQGTTGSQPDFAWMQKLFPWLCTGDPVLRTARVGVASMGSRPIWFREPNGAVWSPAAHNTNNPNRWSDVFLWIGRPWQGDGQGNQNFPVGMHDPIDSDLLGKKGKTGSETPNGWSGPDKQHFTYNSLISYYNLTGNWLAKCLIEELSESILAAYQYPALGGLRPSGSIDSVEAARAFSRGVITMLLMYAVTGREELRQRPHDLFTNHIFGQIQGILPNTEHPVKVLQTSEEVECRNTVGAGINIGPSVGNYSFPWQEGMLPIGLYYIWRAHGDFFVSDYMMAIARAQQLYLWQDMGVQTTTLCQKSAACGSGFNGKSFSGWHMPKAMLYSGPGLSEGEPLPSTRFTDCGYVDWDSQAEIWSIAGVVLGWEWAQQTADTAWASRCVEIINGTVPDAEGRAGPNGFGVYPETAWEEWIGVIRDPFKDRLSTNKELFANFSGSGDMIGTQLLRVFVEITSYADFDNDGFIDTPVPIEISGEGELIANLGKETGTVVYVELWTNPDDLWGSGGFTAAELTKFPSIFKELVTNPDSLWGTGSLTATLTKTPFKELVTNPDSLWGSGSLVAKLTKVLRGEDEHVINGLVFGEHSIEVTVGDKVINEHESFRMFAGNTVLLHVHLVNADGTQFDLDTISSLRWVLVDRDANQVIFDRALGNGILIDANEILIQIPESATAGRAGELYHESKVVTTDNRTFTIFSGTVSVAATHI